MNKTLTALARARELSGPAMLALLIFFQFLDVVTTAVGLHLNLREGNPVVAWMIDRWGMEGLVLSKFLALSMAGFFLYTGRMLLLLRVTQLMGLLVVWNLLWLAVKTP